MTDRGNPIHSQSATFYVSGSKRGQGVLLLYPDELAAVTTPAGTWGYLAGPALIPLELITGVQARKPTKAAGWLGLRNITVTADGTEYEFRGTTEKWMAHLTAALTEYGREVHIAAESITVLPWVTLEEG